MIKAFYFYVSFGANVIFAVILLGFIIVKPYEPKPQEPTVKIFLTNPRTGATSTREVLLGEALMLMDQSIVSKLKVAPQE